MKPIALNGLLLLILTYNFCGAQIRKDSTISGRPLKNVIRYNLSGALLFGADRYIVFGYERIVGRNQSVSINFGKISFPRFTSINTGSVSLEKDTKNSGINFSADYRFYLPKENKYAPPHGLYIGPYYSFNRFIRDNEWDFIGNPGNYINTHTTFTIHTVGFELGYQLVLWKRVTIDFLLVGPGLGFYNAEVSLDTSLDQETKEALLDGIDQLITQRFPGMNYILSDTGISANGTLSTTSLGYRYLIHVGFIF